MAAMQMRVVLVVLGLALVAHARTVKTQRKNPDQDLTTPELIVKYGYPAESHTVQTSDGYLLTLHRIPHGKGADPSVRGPPILLQHGLLCSSADWVVMGPEKGFAYLLADVGYDVWMGNVRGNTYSRKNVHMTPSDNAFWEFSWHEMGVIDVPAMIDYILEKTGETSLFYAGHSMGTTMFYVMGSERPEYNAKIRAMFSLAPVAFMSHLKSPMIQLASKVGNELEWLLNLMGIYEFMPQTELLTLIGQVFCNDAAITQEICSNVLFLIGGYDSAQLNRTMLPVILGHTPAGASTKELVHYGQGVQSAKFRQYDYGFFQNLLKYGWGTPPDYDLSKVTAPVALHYSDNDWLAAVVDVEELHSKLPNCIAMHKVALPAFNHLDYLWAIDSPQLVYEHVLSLMSKY
ncbi:lipase 3-like [Periplaneta americana]|uniref:lipase 3-like n=1 Tax=Periplaneta americana TaxID=6978 RepID=UPI0037E89999